MRIDVNITVGSFVRPEDSELFSGEQINRHYMRTDINIANILRDMGIFKSTTQARNSGWNKIVPDGWTDVTIGKLKNRICIWNPTE